MGRAGVAVVHSGASLEPRSKPHPFASRGQPEFIPVFRVLDRRRPLS